MSCDKITKVEQFESFFSIDAHIQMANKAMIFFISPQKKPVKS